MPFWGLFGQLFVIHDCSMRKWLFPGFKITCGQNIHAILDLDFAPRKKTKQNKTRKTTKRKLVTTRITCYHFRFLYQIEILKYYIYIFNIHPAVHMVQVSRLRTELCLCRLARSWHARRIPWSSLVAGAIRSSLRDPGVYPSAQVCCATEVSRRKTEKQRGKYPW